MKQKAIEIQEYRPRGTLPPEIVDYIEQCRLADHSESYLIAVLHRIQNHFGYLSKENLDAVSYLMQIPATQVTGVASFYHYFSFVPRGEHRVSVCLGTACYVKGSAKLVERLQDLLGIGVGETTKDGKFSIETTRCVGACALAPVMIVDEEVHGAVKADEVAKILAKYGFDKRKG